MLTTVTDFFSKYSEFFDQDFQVELNKFESCFNAFVQIKNGFEEIGKSESQASSIGLLEQVDLGTDMIVSTMEDCTEYLPVSILSRIQVIFIRLPVQIKEVLEEYVIQEPDHNPKAIKKHLRQINRAISSGALAIEKTIRERRNQLLTKSEEE